MELHGEDNGVQTAAYGSAGGLKAMSQESRLVDLRRKTDRDLVTLIKGELYRGLTLAEVAGTKESPLFEKAERAYQMVKAWLPLVSGLSRDEGRKLKLTLNELRSVLDRVPSEKVRRNLASASAG